MSTTTIDYTTIDGLDDGVTVLAAIKANIQAAETDMALRPTYAENAVITGDWQFNNTETIFGDISAASTTDDVTIRYGQSTWLGIEGAGNSANSSVGINFRQRIISGAETLAGRITSQRSGSADDFDLVLQSANSGVLQDGIFIESGSGKVGINNQTPTELLHVRHSSTVAAIKVESVTNQARLKLMRAALESTIYQDSNGLAFDAGGNQTFHTSSTERIRILTDGKIGIGTTIPTEDLHVKASHSRIAVQVNDDAEWAGVAFHNAANVMKGNIIYTPSLDLMIFYTAGSSQMRLSSAGNLGLGSSTSYKLDVTGTTRFTGNSILATITAGVWNGTAIDQAYLVGQSGINTGDEVDASTVAKGIIELATATEVNAGSDNVRAVVPSTLNLWNGSATAMSWLNTTVSTSKTTGGAVFSGGIGVAGDINAGGDITAYATSDWRLKKNIQRLINPSVKLRALNGYKFKFIEGHDEGPKSGLQYGLIAQEVQKIMPELISHNEAGELSIKVGGYELIALLVEGWKELDRRLTSLEKI